MCELFDLGLGVFRQKCIYMVVVLSMTLNNNACNHTYIHSFVKFLPAEMVKVEFSFDPACHWTAPQYTHLSFIPVVFNYSQVPNIREGT